MNIKRILSTALTVVIIFTTIVAVIPVSAGAAYTESGSSVSAAVPEGYTEANLDSEALKVYLAEFLEYNFETASEMLDYELSCGYLYAVNSQGNYYTMYINKYTGFVYYVNNVTGQILTSNPINPGYLNNIGSLAVQQQYRESVMSQISISFFETANSLQTFEYNSFKWAANRAQISVSPISGGLRVNYTLGDTTARFLLPGRITAKDFDEYIVMPIIEQYDELLQKYCAEAYPDEVLSFFDNEDYTHYEYDCINTSSSTGLKKYLTATANLFKKALKNDPVALKEMDNFSKDAIKLLNAYTLNAPQKYLDNDKFKDTLNQMYEKYPITKEGIAIYVYSGNQLAETKRPLSEIVKKFCPDYTFSMMFEDEKECGYVDDSPQKPVFRCALEYTFNADGSLSVRLPASSITFDETVYTLNSITPLQFFGCGDMTKEGYAFYPDGSGTIIEFEDFYNEANNKKLSMTLSSNIYGVDYCYSKITGAHRAQVTMPIYGLVNEAKANAVTEYLYETDTVTNGFFAIVEEGSALANLSFRSGGTAHRYFSVFASYTPYPADEFDLSETLSVGSVGTYKIVSESKYTGSYVTRYAMLTDDEVGEVVYGKDAYYKSDYVGMASYYRNYLKNNGVLTALEGLSEDLPLYIEVLGAMDISAKFLSFPITKSIPLTSFDDIEEIYNQLSQCEEYVQEKISEYEELASKEKDDNQKYQYEKQAERYRALVGNIQSIKNINFKLTGFTNGGMKSTYPVKIKWARATGGKSGFKSLVKEAAKISEAADSNFVLYPEFDFAYINNVAMFDGISNKGNVSKMVDNRYATKQIYDSIMQEYHGTFSMLISADALDKLYSKFLKKYSKYDINTISVSTLGSDLNSNFDKDNPINREEAKEMISQLLDRMVNENGYELMTDVGNIYAVEYATHILNATIDSSHFRYSSYTVPFTGLILHSYVNYTGSPLNYSGSPAYDLLRAIESGASLYYIVCYQNSSHLKEDRELNKYYGIDYHNWYDDILTTYKELNSAIGDLQYYEIVDHTTILSEREIEDSEAKENYVRLQEEIVMLLDEQILAVIDEALASLKGNNNYDIRVKFDVTDAGREALLSQFADILNIDVSEFEGTDFVDQIDAVIEKYESKYCGDDANGNSYVINFSSIDYKSQYSYITDSCAFDKDYVYTNYTIDNGNVTMVTYKNGDSEVRFILNYNNYPVTVRLSSEVEYRLEGYSYKRIDGEVQ